MSDPQNPLLAPQPGSGEPRAIDLWDPADKRSVINLVPFAVSSAMKDAAAHKPDLFQLDERDLFNRLRTENKTPSPTDNRIRLAFWMEYNRAQDTGSLMNMGSVYAGCCSKQYFYAAYLANADKVAWMACAPVNYVLKMEEALDFGLDRLRDILEMPVKENGRVNVKLAELQAKIVAMIDQRVKGAVVQKTMNLHASVGERSVANLAEANTMEALQRRLKELERRERVAQNLITEERSEPGEKIVDAEIVSDENVD